MGNLGADVVTPFGKPTVVLCFHRRPLIGVGVASPKFLNVVLEHGQFCIQSIEFGGPIHMFPIGIKKAERGLDLGVMGDHTLTIPNSVYTGVGTALKQNSPSDTEGLPRIHLADALLLWPDVGC